MFCKKQCWKGRMLFMAQGKHLCHTSVYLLAEEDWGDLGWGKLSFEEQGRSSLHLITGFPWSDDSPELLYKTNWGTPLTPCTCLSPCRRKVSGTPGLPQCRHRPLPPSIPALTTAKMRTKMTTRDTTRMRKLKGTGRTSSPPFPSEPCHKGKRSSTENTGTELVALTLALLRIHSTVSAVGLASFVLRTVWYN